MPEQEDTQSRFNNRQSDYLTAAEAMAALGVKQATLYTYVSRGWVQRVPSGKGRRNLYLRSDIERLTQRRDARSGHTAAAAGALRWGEPVIETAISELRDGQIRYRGQPLLALVERGGFEEVAELLWGGDAPRGLGPGTVGPVPTPHDLLAIATALREADRERLVTRPERERARGRALIAAFAGADPRREAPAGRSAPRLGVAGALCDRFGERRPEVLAAVDRALILSAEHGLNASTFAARVVASTGADLYSVVSGALCAFSGPLHGGAGLRIEALLDRVRRPEEARAWVAGCFERGETVPGFVHRLYPDGDPRGGPLMADALRLGDGPDLYTLAAIADAMAGAGWRTPTVDFGLSALCLGLGWPRGAGAWIFAVGRAAGWVAHALEQRAAGTLLRPRASYTGL
jgi:citrate synthase